MHKGSAKARGGRRLWRKIKQAVLGPLFSFFFLRQRQSPVVESRGPRVKLGFPAADLARQCPRSLPGVSGTRVLVWAAAGRACHGPSARLRDFFKLLGLFLSLGARR